MRDPYLNKIRALLLLATTRVMPLALSQVGIVCTERKRADSQQRVDRNTQSFRKKTENEHAKLNFKTEAPQQTC